MPRFVLASDRAQVFEIGDRRYEVPARGLVEIPEAFTYVIARRGLPLVAADDVPATAPSARVVLDGAPPPGLLAQIPAESRAGFLRHWEGCATQIERSALLREIQRWIAERAADEAPVEPEADETPATAPAVSEDDVDAQIAAVAPRGRRRAKE